MPIKNSEEAHILNHPAATEQGLQILRNGSTFQWYVMPMLAFVVYVYANEIAKKNWKSVAAGLSLYTDAM